MTGARRKMSNRKTKRGKKSIPPNLDRGVEKRRPEKRKIQNDSKVSKCHIMRATG